MHVLINQQVRRCSRSPRCPLHSVMLVCHLAFHSTLLIVYCIVVCHIMLYYDTTLNYVKTYYSIVQYCMVLSVRRCSRSPHCPWRPRSR